MIEQALYARLSGYAALAAVVGTRIYPVKRPQDSDLPALSYFRVAGAGSHTHEGATGLAEPRFQVSVWAATAFQAAEIANLVRLALDGFKGTVAGVVIESIFLVNNGPDIFEDGLELFHRPMDFDVCHQEARP